MGAEALEPGRSCGCRLNETERKHAPKTRYISGDLETLSCGGRVAIVGSRKVSADGLKRASRLARMLSEQGRWWSVGWLKGSTQRPTRWAFATGAARSLSSAPRSIGCIQQRIEPCKRRSPTLTCYCRNFPRAIPSPRRISHSAIAPSRSSAMLRSSSRRETPAERSPWDGKRYGLAEVFYRLAPRGA